MACKHALYQKEGDGDSHVSCTDSLPVLLFLSAHLVSPPRFSVHGAERKRKRKKNPPLGSCQVSVVGFFLFFNHLGFFGRVPEYVMSPFLV